MPVMPVVPVMPVMLNRLIVHLVWMHMLMQLGCKARLSSASLGKQQANAKAIEDTHMPPICTH